MTKLAVTLTAMAATLLAGCIEPRIDKPAAPETEPLSTSYTVVMGELESATMEATVQAVETTVADTGGVCGWESLEGLICADPAECNGLFTCASLSATTALVNRVKDLILDASNSEDETIETETGDEVFTTPFQQAEGFVTVRRTCSGHGSLPTVDDANGRIVMTAGFTNLTLDPVIWADFEACKFRVLNAPFTSVTITGRLLVVLSTEPVRPDTAISFLTGFDFEIETELGTADIAASFQFDPDGTRLLILIKRDEGDLIFYSSPGRTGFLTASGDYACDFTGRVCTGPEGRTVAW